MFEEFLEKSKRKWEKQSQEILLELEKEYDNFWHQLVEDLNRKKLGLEQDVRKLDESKMTKEKRIFKLSEDLISLEEGIKKVDSEKRKVIYYDLQTIFYDDAPTVVLNQGSVRRYQRDWIQGWYWNPCIPRADIGGYFYPLSKG